MRYKFCCLRREFNAKQYSISTVDQLSFRRINRRIRIICSHRRRFYVSRRGVNIIIFFLSFFNQKRHYSCSSFNLRLSSRIRPSTRSIRSLYACASGSSRTWYVVGMDAHRGWGKGRGTCPTLEFDKNDVICCRPTKYPKLFDRHRYPIFQSKTAQKKR